MANLDLQNCIQFDGVTNNVTVPDNAAYSYVTNSALTVSVWINPATLTQPTPEGTGYVHFLSKLDSSQNEWTFRMYSQGNSEARNNRISFYIFQLSGGLGDGAYFEDTVIPGQWIHLVATVDAGKNVRLYKNGVLRNMFTTSALTLGNGTAPVRIASGASGQSFFQGKMDDVRVYNRVLSDDEVMDLFNFNSLNPSGLVGRFAMDEGTGTTVSDSSVTANNGTLNGTPAWTTSLKRNRQNVFDKSPTKYRLVNTTTETLPQRRTIEGVPSKSLILNGTTQYASIADGSQSGLGFALHDFIIGGWFKIQAGAVIQTLFEKYSGSGYGGSANTNIGWEVIYRGDQATKSISLRMQDGTNTGIVVSFTLSTQTIADGNWHHIIFDVARATSATIWIDAAQCISPNSIVAMTNSFTNTGAFRVGVRQDATAGFYAGLISNLFVYDFGVNGRPSVVNIVALINDIYYRSIYAASGLVSRWTFDNTPNDVVGVNNLTLTGSPSYSTDVPIQARNNA